MTSRIRGIYMLKNKVDGRVYIGSSARSCGNRCSNHMATLRKGTHTNKFLQRAFNKYGEKAFSFTVIGRRSKMRKTTISPQCREAQRKLWKDPIWRAKMLRNNPAFHKKQQQSVLL